MKKIQIVFEHPVKQDQDNPMLDNINHAIWTILGRDVIIDWRDPTQ